jgi:hypothetical protein
MWDQIGLRAVLEINLKVPAWTVAMGIRVAA